MEGRGGICWTSGRCHTFLIIDSGANYKDLSRLVTEKNGGLVREYPQNHFNAGYGFIIFFAQIDTIHGPDFLLATTWDGGISTVNNGRFQLPNLQLVTVTGFLNHQRRIFNWLPLGLVGYL